MSIDYRPTYLHERMDWPTFRWDEIACASSLERVNMLQTELLNSMAQLGFDLRQESTLAVLVQDVQKSSEIEGEILDLTQVRSSLARRLGMDVGALPFVDRNVEGVVEMMIDATQNFPEPLTSERLFGWHSTLFPSGRSGMTQIIAGRWRDDQGGPMTVISGPIGKERVHFEAPPANRLEAEMRAFLNWFNQERMDPVIKAAIAHLWFVTIHPFDDGNGRIARAISDMALARFDRTNQRYYSMSAQISRRLEGYYEILERTQKASTDVTPWIQWFLERLIDALEAASGVTDLVKFKKTFWEKHSTQELSDRQIKVLNRILEGFEGNLQTSKYASLAKCSLDTALRDLSELVEKGLLSKDASKGGRSTSYKLVS